MMCLKWIIPIPARLSDREDPHVAGPFSSASFRRIGPAAIIIASVDSHAVIKLVVAHPERACFGIGFVVI